MENKARIGGFVRKWDGVRLLDAGSYVSGEFKEFQYEFFAAMRKVAKAIGAEVVGACYGHYYMSGFIRRGDKFVYFCYENLDRTLVRLKDRPTSNFAMYVRTAADERDYHGGTNENVSFEKCESVIDKLLNKEHKRAF